MKELRGLQTLEKAGCAALLRPWCQPSDAAFRFLASGTVRMNLSCFRPLSLWSFVLQAQETNKPLHLHSSCPSGSCFALLCAMGGIWQSPFSDSDRLAAWGYCLLHIWKVRTDQWLLPGFPFLSFGSVILKTCIKYAESLAFVKLEWVVQWFWSCSLYFSVSLAGLLRRSLKSYR